jgi:hypothetical protein
VVKRSKTDAGGNVHFTVGSLRHTGHRAGGVDFKGELGLVKAALLYADGVELISVGASFASGMNELAGLTTPEKLALLRRFLPDMDLGGSRAETERFFGQMDALIEKQRRRRRLSKTDATLLIYLKGKWSEIEQIVDSAMKQWGADDFMVALRSGRLELSPFSNMAPDDILKLGMGASSTQPLADQAWEEYRKTVLEAVSNKTTYPLFDDLTGDIVGKADSKGLLRPAAGTKRRSRHGGLSGDLLQRLPMFERARVTEVLDIREELSDYLDPFRAAVEDMANTIESASWETDFDEEADLVFRGTVGPTVRAIEDRVRSDQSLKEMTYRYGPITAAGAASSLGAFLGTGSVLGGLAVLAGGVAAAAFQGAATDRKERAKIEGERLYFYYRAGRRLRLRR